MLRVLVKKGCNLVEYCNSCASNTNRMNTNAFVIILNQLGLPFTSKQLLDIISAYCNDQLGYIDFSEFFKYIGINAADFQSDKKVDLVLVKPYVFQSVKNILFESISSLNRSIDNIYRMFAKWDTNGNNEITATQFVRVLLRLHVELTDDDQDFLIDILDVSGMGRINFENLLTYCFSVEFPPPSPTANRSNNNLLPDTADCGKSVNSTVSNSSFHSQFQNYLNPFNHSYDVSNGYQSGQRRPFSASQKESVNHTSIYSQSDARLRQSQALLIRNINDVQLNLPIGNSDESSNYGVGIANLLRVKNSRTRPLTASSARTSLGINSKSPSLGRVQSLHSHDISNNLIDGSQNHVNAAIQSSNQNIKYMKKYPSDVAHLPDDVVDDDDDDENVMNDFNMSHVKAVQQRDVVNSPYSSYSQCIVVDNSKNNQQPEIIIPNISENHKFRMNSYGPTNGGSADLYDLKSSDTINTNDQELDEFLSPITTGYDGLNGLSIPSNAQSAVYSPYINLVQRRQLQDQNSQAHTTIESMSPYQLPFSQQSSNNYSNMNERLIDQPANVSFSDSHHESFLSNIAESNEPREHLQLLADQYLKTIRDIILASFDSTGQSLTTLYGFFNRKFNEDFTKGIENRVYVAGVYDGFDLADFMSALKDLNLDLSERIASLVFQRISIDKFPFVSFGEFKAFVLGLEIKQLETNIQKYIGMKLEERGIEYIEEIVNMIESFKVETIIAPNNPLLTSHSGRATFSEVGDANIFSVLTAKLDKLTMLDYKSKSRILRIEYFIKFIKLLNIPVLQQHNGGDMDRLVMRFDASLYVQSLQTFSNLYEVRDENDNLSRDNYNGTDDVFCSLSRFLCMIFDNNAYFQQEISNLRYQQISIYECKILRQQLETAKQINAQLFVSVKDSQLFYKSGSRVDTVSIPSLNTNSNAVDESYSSGQSYGKLYNNLIDVKASGNSNYCGTYANVTIPVPVFESTSDYVHVTYSLVNMSEFLGICPVSEAYLLWIVEHAIKIPLPQPWVLQVDPKGRNYFYNQLTQESSWKHPLNSYFRMLRNKYRNLHYMSHISLLSSNDSQIINRFYENGDKAAFLSKSSLELGGNGNVNVTDEHPEVDSLSGNTRLQGIQSSFDSQSPKVGADKNRDHRVIFQTLSHSQSQYIPSSQFHAVGLIRPVSAPQQVNASNQSELNKQKSESIHNNYDHAVHKLGEDVIPLIANDRDLSKSNIVESRPNTALSSGKIEESSNIIVGQNMSVNTSIPPSNSLSTLSSPRTTILSPHINYRTSYRKHLIDIQRSQDISEQKQLVDEKRQLTEAIYSAPYQATPHISQEIKSGGTSKGNPGLDSYLKKKYQMISQLHLEQSKQQELQFDQDVQRNEHFNKVVSELISQNGYQKDLSGQLVIKRPKSAVGNIPAHINSKSSVFRESRGRSVSNRPLSAVDKLMNLNTKHGYLKATIKQLNYPNYDHRKDNFMKTEANLQNKLDEVFSDDFITKLDNIILPNKTSSNSNSKIEDKVSGRTVESKSSSNLPKLNQGKKKSKGGIVLL